MAKIVSFRQACMNRLEACGKIVGSGYVVKSLEAALWAFHDADTTGAVCGQLTGAYWGESGIPGGWLEGLARRDMIERALHGSIGGEQ